MGKGTFVHVFLQIVGLTFFQALEDGDDIEEILERPRRKRVATSKFMEDSNRGTPVSDVEMSRPSRKGRKGKGKAAEYDPPANGKRKRPGQKSHSVTPSIAGDDDDDDRVAVCWFLCRLAFF